MHNVYGKVYFIGNFTVKTTPLIQPLLLGTNVGRIRGVYTMKMYIYMMSKELNKTVRAYCINQSLAVYSPNTDVIVYS